MRLFRDDEQFVLGSKGGGTMELCLGGRPVNKANTLLSEGRITYAHQEHVQ